MATIRLPTDFKDFLRLLNSEKVEYLLVGGYAVGYHGYPRATGDLDIWVGVNAETSEALAKVLRQFGFSEATIPNDFELEERKIIRMGVPPLRIEVITGASGINFPDCYLRREVDTIDGVEVNVIALSDLKRNKQAAGRPKDLADLDNLPN